MGKGLPGDGPHKPALYECLEIDPTKVCGNGLGDSVLQSLSNTVARFSLRCRTGLIQRQLPLNVQNDPFLEGRPKLIIY